MTKHCIIETSHEAEQPCEVVVGPEGRLYHLGIKPDEIAPNLVVVGDPARADRVASRFDEVQHVVTHREYRTLSGTCGGVATSVIGTGIGTDNVEIALIEAWAALTLDLETLLPKPNAPHMRVVRVGTSGGAAPDIAPGSLCIAEYALGLDATGPYYEIPAPDNRAQRIEHEAHHHLTQEVPGTSRFHASFAPYVSRASPAVVAALETRCRADLGGCPDEPSWETGITVTSPGFYGASSRYLAGLRNTVEDIKGTLARVQVDGRRVLNFEMESSLLFHLAQGLGIDAGTVCVSISAPSSADTVIDYASCIETAIDIGLGALLDLVRAEDP